MLLKKLTKNELGELKDMINTARWQEKVFLTPNKKLLDSDVVSFIREKKKGQYWNYIIWHKNKIAGYIDFELLKEKRGHIAGIYIKPEFRRKGFATKALDFALEIFKKQGCRLIYANIFSNNKPIKLLFENKGFMKIKRFKHPVAKDLALRLTLNF